MGQEEMVSKQAQTKVEIVRFSIPHTFLAGNIAPNCILGSGFLEDSGRGRFQGEPAAIASRKQELDSITVRRTLKPRRRNKKLKANKSALKCQMISTKQFSKAIQSGADAYLVYLQH